MLIVKSEHSVEEVLTAIDEAQRSQYSYRPYYFHGDRISLRNNRILTFKFNGIKCKHCGIAGVLFRKEKHAKGHNDAEVRSWHLNLYARDRRGNLILMTRDHIIPVSKGGTGSLENSQTLCRRCNGSKGDRMPGEPIRVRTSMPGKLNWNILKRRFKFFIINSWNFKHLMWPSRSGSEQPTITSFWRM